VIETYRDAMPSPIPLRIFLSSPGDVAKERQLARDLIARLNKDHLLKDRVRLEAVSWDDPDAPPSMPANLSPQQAVNRGLAMPCDCDIVVVLFWNRMGTELDPSEGLKANGEPYQSGTEWEFENALAAPTQPDRPVILLYRKTGFTPDASDPDNPELQEQLDQRRKVNAFFAALKEMKRFAIEFTEHSEFEGRLENDLKHRINLLLEQQPGSMGEAFQQTPPTPVGDKRLAHAEARLAAMPLDVVPAPAALPAGSHMPLARNPLFVVREADLKALARGLKAGETAAVGQIAAATGLGGIGKTQLASEFVHRYGQYFLGGVFWLSFADSDAVPAEIATCGGPGGMKLRDDFGRLAFGGSGPAGRGRVAGPAAAPAGVRQLRGRGSAGEMATADGRLPGAGDQPPGNLEHASRHRCPDARRTRPRREPGTSVQAPARSSVG
jgi:hypothetical protein